MRKIRALGYGVLGAAAMSAFFLLLRSLSVNIGIEMLLGTAWGLHPGPAAYVVGLVIHLAMGGAFGLVYGWLFERVWNHGGAGMGVILASIHASIIGMAAGLTPQLHPLVPTTLRDPGAFFANSGTLGVLAFLAAHLVFGAIVGGGYGHVASEREWAPLHR